MNTILQHQYTSKSIFIIKEKKNLVNQFCKIYKNLPPEQVVPYQLNDSHKLPQINNDLIYVIQVKNKAFEMILDDSDEPYLV